MLIIGFLLIAVAAVLFIAMLMAGGDPVALGYFGLELSPFFIFLLGAASVVVFIMGLELTRSGTARSWRRRREMRDLQKTNKKLEKERARTGSTDTGTSTTTGSSAPSSGPAEPPSGGSSTSTTRGTDAPEPEGGSTRS